MTEKFIDDILLKFTNDALAHHDQAPLRNIVDANNTAILWGARRALAVFTLRPIEIVAEMLWKIDYPNGGSIVKKWDDNSFQDKELYRSEAKSIMNINQTRSQPKMQKVDLDKMRQFGLGDASWEANFRYSYNRAIDDIKSKYGELYAEVKDTPTVDTNGKEV